MMMQVTFVYVVSNLIASGSTCVEEGLKANEEGCVVRLGVAEVTLRLSLKVIDLEPEPEKSSLLKFERRRQFLSDYSHF